MDESRFIPKINSNFNKNVSKLPCIAKWRFFLQNVAYINNAVSFRCKRSLAASSIWKWEGRGNFLPQENFPFRKWGSGNERHYILVTVLSRYRSICLGQMAREIADKTSTWNGKRRPHVCQKKIKSFAKIGELYLHEKWNW